MRAEIRRVLDVASDGGRIGAGRLALWAIGGGWTLLALIAAILCLEPTP